MNRFSLPPPSKDQPAAVLSDYLRDHHQQVAAAE